MSDNVLSMPDTALTSNQPPQENTVQPGCCTFVKEWYEGIAAQKPGKNRLSTKICDRCHGLFTSSTSLLPNMKLKSRDKMGETIKQMYPSGEDFAIYRTRQGVIINFADCRAREREQRKQYAVISEKLCRLRFLTSQMAGWLGLKRLSRTGGFYEHQIAEAIYLVMQGKPDQAGELLDLGLKLANERLTNENRVRYLIACLATAVIPALFWGAVHLGFITFANWQVYSPYFLSGLAGAVGAVFSIALRIQQLNLEPCAQSVMNYVMGALRILTGFTGGAIILLIINGTGLGDGILSLFKSIRMDSVTDASWKCIVLVGFLAGFAERLIPSLLQTLESRVENPAVETEAAQARAKDTGAVGAGQKVASPAA